MKTTWKIKILMLIITFFSIIFISTTKSEARIDELANSMYKDMYNLTYAWLDRKFKSVLCRARLC